MSETAHDPEVLIQHYLEDCLTEAEAAAFLQLLNERPELGQRLLGQLSMDAMLRETRDLASLPAESISALPATHAPVKSPPRFSYSTLSSVAALAACVTLLGNWFTQRLTTPGMEAEATTAAVAVLTRGVNLVWESEAHAPGSPLTPGWLYLKSGLAQIEFYQGARVTLEGPAAFQLISSSEVQCTSGKLSAHVPPQAKGFRVQTPKGLIVDLGTDFGLDLNDPAAPVHVFKGEVELHGATDAVQSLKEGQAMAMADTARSMVADQAAFASLNNVEERTAESERLAFEDWLLRSRSWSQDQGLLLHFDFQDGRQTRSLKNHALPKAEVPAGSIVGCEWTEGRWPGKRALEFRNVSDRVRLSIPSEHLALSFSTWVRINGLDRSYNSLFMTEGYQNGAAHWQITREGKLRLGIASRAGQPARDYDTPAIFTPELFGQWLHLATTIDPLAKEVRHYLNGKLIISRPRTEVFAVSMPLAELGNWNNHGPSDRVAIRHFSGVMDEFLLFNRVLTPDEITKLAQ
jgi:ferric-dicitrate binding protein FerR (iron transport regulator)